MDFSLAESLGAFELTLIGLVLVNVAVYMYGASANKSLASATVKSLTESVLEANFSRIDEMQADSADSFSIYATGRKAVSGVTVSLSLAARQDFSSQLASLFSAGQSDMLTIEFHDVETKEPILAALGRRGVWSKIQEKFPILKNCRKNERDLLANKSINLPFIVTGDSQEISDLLSSVFAPNVLADVESLVISDSSLQMTVRLAHNVPVLVQGVFALLDRICSSFTLSEKSRMAARELRTPKETPEQLRQRLDAKKAEKLRTMSAEERDKHEKKVEKKQMMKQAIRQSTRN